MFARRLEPGCRKKEGLNFPLVGLTVSESPRPRVGILFRFNGRDERQRLQLVAVQFRLLEGFHGAEGDALLVGFQHDPLALLDIELEDMPERFQDMLHAVRVVVVQ